jgi:hypothetical protein
MKQARTLDAVDKGSQAAHLGSWDTTQGCGLGGCTGGVDSQGAHGSSQHVLGSLQWIASKQENALMYGAHSSAYVLVTGLPTKLPVN